MHTHDPDLIAAIAEGTLSPEEAAAAERSLVGCAECMADVAAHRQTLAAIAASPRPGLSMSESADLRRAIRSAVGAEPPPQPEPTRRPWLGLATAAAVVILLLAVAPLVNVLSTRDGDSAATDTTISADRTAAATTAVPATEAPAALAPAEAAPTTAESETQAGADDGALFALPRSRLEFRDVSDLNSFLGTIAEGLDDLEGTRALTDQELSYYADRFSVALEDQESSCSLDSVGGDGVTAAITVGRAEIGGVEFLIVAVSTDAGTRHVVALDPLNCEVLGQVEA